MAVVLNVKSLVLLAMVVAAVAVSATASSEDATGLVRFPGRRRRRHRHGNLTPSPTPNRPSPTPAPPAVPAPGTGRVPAPPPPPPPPPPGNLLPCDRPDVPPMLDPAAGGGASPPADCLPSRPPRAPPQPPRFRRPQLCTCPVPKPRPGFAVPAPAGEACVGPLMSLMMTCGPFLTGSAEETPTPQSDCCSGLSALVNASTAVTAGGNGDAVLRCLCPVILGQVNKNLPRPVDPVRLMYLPIACGVVLPPQALFVCFTGHPSPQVVSSFSQVWDNVHG